MRAVIRSSLRFRLLIVALAAGVLALGVTQLRDAPVDVLPEFTPPYAEIQTEALGLSAEEVENLITVPLEQQMLNGVQGVDTIRSQSVAGLSSIVLVFEPGTDVYRARQLINERLIGSHALPAARSSKPPTLLQPLSSSSRVLMIGLSSDRLTPIEQSVIARWTMRPRLMGVPGVANVAVWGLRDQQLQVQVDPEVLRDRGLRLSQIVSTAGNAQVVSPLSFLEASTPGSGGFIETPQQRLQVRNVFERIADPAALGRVPVEGTDGRLRLSDVADVKIDHQPLIGDAVVDGADGLMLVVEKFPGANALEVTRGVEAALEDLRPGLSGMQTDTSVFRPATFIEEAIDNLTLALILGAVFMALVLAALLFQWRAVIVALVTIPLSLVAAALVLDALGETFNAISFAGLAVAIAVVVDDAVATTANVARRMREHRDAGSAKPATTIVLEASHEARTPLMFATLILLLAIVPVAVMSGRPGAFFEPLALSYALAVGAALAVALTVTPALSALLYARGSAGRRESPLVRSMGAGYGRALARFLRRPRNALLAAAACLLVGVATLPLLGTSLLPSFKDRDVLVRLTGEPGVSNPRMTQLATAVTRELRSIPGVENAGAHIGRAVTGDQIVDVNSSEVWVGIAPDADYDETLADIRAAVRRVPDVQRDVVGYSAQQIRDVGALEEGENPVRGDGIDVLTGSDTPLVARVYGHDSEVLRREATRVRDLMAGVDGVVNPRVQLPREQPAVEIEVDLAKSQRFGIKPGDVRRAEATLLQGIQVGSVFDDQKVFDVVVQGPPDIRTDVDNIRNLLIDRPGGGHVRLGQVADVRLISTPIAIEREAIARKIDVEASVSGRDLEAVADDVRRRLADTAFPLEFHAEVFEETAGAETGITRMIAFTLAAALAAFLLLQAAFRSWRLAIAVAAALPVALVGGLVAALVAGAELSLGSLIGLLGLFALAVRMGISLVRHLQDLDDRRGGTFRRAAVERGAGERLGPMATTILAVALLLAPIVVLGSRPGLEIVHPMAVVMLGGLVTVAFVSLFVLPAAYLSWGAPTMELDARSRLVRQWPGPEPEPETDVDGRRVPVDGGVAEPAPHGGNGARTTNGEARETELER